jgi:hypothetical protein
MIAVARCDYAPRGLFGSEQRDLVRGAAELEGAGVLKMLQLEIYGRGIQMDQFHGSFANIRRDAAVRREDVRLHSFDPV